ncbi:NAD-dependent epimerase/dehydratase family protein [Dongia deserti]|uniref:NAD-dependent epimerase/dehydratase family protein n=1 Tax=Dongia deserti TaxID=2268030 RepID=UPI0013C4EF65|nr:NAD-dependent epimerase/dehydratase family protein [Dongia deserti]
MGKLAAVTGATGFIGRQVVTALWRQGWGVRVLARRHPAELLSPHHGFQLVLGDLDDSSALERLVEGADAIIHLGGIVKAPRRRDFYSVNEGGTQRLLLAAARAAPAAMLVHVSSIAAREPRLSPYCDSKYRAEQAVRGLAGDRIWTILRPPAVYGPGDREIRPIFTAAKLGIVPYPASPGAALSMIHVADLAEAIAACLTRSGPPQATFEIDDGVPGGYRWPDILSALGEAVGRKPAGLRLPRAGLLAVAQANRLMTRIDGRARILQPHKVAEIYWPDWVVHGNRLEQVSDWRPAFDIWRGFRDAAKWYAAANMV